MWSGDKDGLSTYAVHVDTGSRFQVIQVYIAIFSNKENHIVFGAYLLKRDKELHSYKKWDNKLRHSMFFFSGVTGQN